MTKQNKGKDLSKIPASKLVDGQYYASIKYDGFYTQIQYYNNIVTFHTSGGKEFYLDHMAEYIKKHFTEDFHIECEYNYSCPGYLGDRGKSAILTTYRTNYTKQILTRGNSLKDIFRVLDIIDTNHTFKQRHKRLMDLFFGKKWFDIPTQYIVNSLQGGKDLAKGFVEEGYEGAMLKSPDHIYKPGKRTNDIIKIKPRLTADLLCVAWKEGEGKYAGLIGSLLLQDSNGIQVAAGSGLSDSQRSLPANSFIGQVIEIEYETQSDNGVWLQPIIKHIRYDKSPKDIT